MEKDETDVFMPLWRKKQIGLKDNAECKHKEGIMATQRKRTSPKKNDYKQGSGKLKINVQAHGSSRKAIKIIHRQKREQTISWK